MTPQQSAIAVSVAGYMAGMLLIGWWASTRVKDTKDYIIAGGRLGWLLSLGTIFATWFGSETCMGSSGTAFQEGILGVIADPFGAALCLILAGFFFARYFKRLNIATIVDFFELRYGRRAAGFMSLVYLPVYLGWIGAQLLAFGTILHALAGIPLVTAVAVATVVIVVYTFAGGMWADTMTDFFQVIILVAGLLVLYPILVKDVGGFAAAAKSVPAELFHVYPRSASPLTWLNYLQAWMIVGIGSLPAQDLFQRIMSARTAAISKWSCIIAGVFYLGFGLLPVFLGILARLVLPAETAGDRVLIDLALKYLSPWLTALMIGALLSAIMSSADSAILAPASIIGKNIVASLKPGAGEQMKLAWCKASVPLLAGLSLLLAIYFQNIYELCLEAWGVLLVGLAAPMMAGVYWKRANTPGALAGAVVGIVTWLALRIFAPEEIPGNLCGLAASFLALIVVSLATQGKAKPLAVAEPAS